MSRGPSVNAAGMEEVMRWFAYFRAQEQEGSDAMAPSLPHLRADELVRACVLQGFRVNRTADGWLVVAPNGARTSFHESTVNRGSGRDYRNVIRDLRHIGFDPNAEMKRQRRLRRRRLMDDRAQAERAIALADRRMRMEQEARPTPEPVVVKADVGAPTVPPKVTRCGIGDCKRVFVGSNQAQAAGLHRARAHGYESQHPDTVRRREMKAKQAVSREVARFKAETKTAKARPDLVGTLLTTAEAVEALIAERDKLQAETEELRAEMSKLSEMAKALRAFFDAAAK